MKGVLIIKDKFELDELDSEINKVVKILKKDLGTTNIDILKSLDFNELYTLHYSLGTYVRNNYILNNKPLCDAFSDEQIFSLDEMSKIIINHLYYDLTID